MRAAALALVERGFSVFPCAWIVERDGERECSCSPDCASPGKHPMLRHGVKEASRDPETVERWWRRWPRAHVAIACGEASGVCVLDVDGEPGRRSLAELLAKHGALPATLTAHTGSGGAHHFFRADARIRNRARFLPGLDTRSDHGYVIAAPSGHMSGGSYAWQGPEPGAAPLAEAPGWLVEAVLAGVGARAERKPLDRVALAAQTNAGGIPDRYVRRAVEGGLADVASSPEGSRRTTLNRVAFAWGSIQAGGGKLEQSDLASLHGAAQATGLGEREVAKTIRDAYGDGLGHPRVLAPKPRVPRACTADAGVSIAPAAPCTVSHPSSLRDQRVWVVPARLAGEALAEQLGAVTLAMPAGGEEEALALLADDTEPVVLALGRGEEAPRDALVLALREAGREVLLAGWDPDAGKGLDDLLAAGGSPRIFPAPDPSSRRWSHAARAVLLAAGEVAPAGAPKSNLTQAGYCGEFGILVRCGTGHEKRLTRAACARAICRHCGRISCDLLHDVLAERWTTRAVVYRAELEDTSPEAARARAVELIDPSIRRWVRWILAPGLVLLVVPENAPRTVHASLVGQGLRGLPCDPATAAALAVGPRKAVVARLHVLVERRAPPEELAAEPWLRDVKTTCAGKAAQAAFPWPTREEVRLRAKARILEQLERLRPLAADGEPDPYGPCHCGDEVERYTGVHVHTRAVLTERSCRPPTFRQLLTGWRSIRPPT